MVISLEVAEHIPEKFADHFVRTLITMAKKAVVITAAPPGQGGTDHVNEQPYEYWIDRFNLAGASYSRELTEAFRNEWALCCHADAGDSIRSCSIDQQQAVDNAGDDEKNGEVLCPRRFFRC